MANSNGGIIGVDNPASFSALISTFTSSGTYSSPPSTTSVDYLVVGGGAGGFILRQMFNNARACKLQIFDPQGQEIGLIDKPFRFIFSEMAAIGKNTQGMGEVGRVKRVSMITRNYTISVGGVNQFSIKSSLFQFGRFKFDITRNGIVVASIAKKYEGFMKMAFTQADNFSIQFFDKNLTLEERYSLFATLFLIDFDVFEQR